MGGGARHALAAALLLAAGTGASAMPCEPGELALPGTTTCLRLGGVLRADAKASTGAAIVPAGPEGGRRRSASALRAGARVDLDARVPTASGPLRAYVSVATDRVRR